MTEARCPRVARADLALFAAVYAVQGVVFAFFMNFVQPYMAAAGVDLATIGTVQTIVMIPFVVKFLAGPISDRFNVFGLGHRLPYIVFGLAVQGVALAALTFTHPGSGVVAFAATATIAVLGMALYDTCCDGLIVDATPASDRPRVQGIVTASRFIAATICTLGFGLWLDRTGNGPGRGDHALWACAAAALVPLALALTRREPPRAADAERFQWRALKILVRRRSLVLLAFGALYAMTGYGVEINLEPYYRSVLSLRPRDVGAVAAARNIGRAIGAGALPLLLPTIGRTRTLTLGLLGLAGATAGQALAVGRGSAGALGLLFGVANGWDDALFFWLAMEASDPRMAASTYALFMAASNLSIVSGGLFAAAVTALDGRYRTVLVSASVLSLAALPLVPALARPPVPPNDDEDGHAV